MVLYEQVITAKQEAQYRSRPYSQGDQSFKFIKRKAAPHILICTSTFYFGRKKIHKKKQKVNSTSHVIAFLILKKVKQYEYLIKKYFQREVTLQTRDEIYFFLYFSNPITRECKTNSRCLNILVRGRSKITPNIGGGGGAECVITHEKYKCD